MVGRERAAWLVVPAIWPSQQFYYGTIALPATEQGRAGPDRLPVPGNGLLALGALALVTWSHGDRGLWFAQPVSTRAATRSEPRLDSEAAR